MGTSPPKPICSVPGPSELAELVLWESHLRDSWVGVPAWTVRPRAFYLVLARGSLFTKAWTNSSGPMCRSCSCTRKRGVSKRRKGCPLGAWHGPTALPHGGSTALFRVVTELSTILKMSAPPFLCPGGCFSRGRVSVSTGVLVE